ncbi:MAG: hypothetical protein ACI8PZ_004629 [Myxococcota bacterium]
MRSGWDRASPWLCIGVLFMLGLRPSTPTPWDAAVARTVGGGPESVQATPIRWSLEVGRRRAVGAGEAALGPGGRFAVSLRGPVGLVPMLRLRGDGEAVSVTLAGARRHWVADEAAGVLATVGAPALDDLVGLALGHVPVTRDHLREVRTTATGLWTRWDLRGRPLVLELDPEGSVRRARLLDEDGVPLVSMTWAADGVEVVAADADARLRLSGLRWSPVVGRMPTFAVSAPLGFDSSPIEMALDDGVLVFLMGELIRPPR